MKQLSSSITLLLFIIISSCGLSSNYNSTVKSELAKGVRYDSLFLGLSLGMTQQAFYDTCWTLNKSGLTREGAMNTTVHYPNDKLKHEGSLDFFPIFKGGKVQSMTGFTQYTNWAPWRPELWSEHLIEDTKAMFEDWLGGNKFFAVKSPTNRGKAYIKIDGNRRIVLMYSEDNKVEMLISDLTNLDDVLKLKN